MGISGTLRSIELAGKHKNVLKMLGPNLSDRKVYHDIIYTI